MGCTDSREEDFGAASEYPVTSGQEANDVLSCYTLGSELGKGGFGKVHSARHQRTGCEVAIKFVDAAETSQEDFEHEAKMLKVLQHPRVVQLHAAVTTPDCWVLLMDVYKGGNLDTVVQAHWATKGPLALPVVQNVSRMMFEATAWMHEKSIVHRDLKQTNFLVDRRDVTDPDIKVVLCDVATATIVSEGQRKQRQVGTSVFWAPEVWERNYGLSADIWALGVTTYTLSLKAWPFNGERQVCQQPLQWPGQLVCDRWGRDANDVARSFVSGLLKKKEADRLTATTALEHAFLVPGAVAKALESTPAMEAVDNKSMDTAFAKCNDAEFSDGDSTDVPSSLDSLMEEQDSEASA